ncbi:MAG: hypothetical protein ACR2QB_02650 [Gammaproteobacteria bacterium]
MLTRTKNSWRLATAALLGFMGGLVMAGGEDFTRIPPQMLALITQAEDAFLAQDAAAVGPYLAQDYSWYQVNDQGAKLMIQGRDNTVALLGGFFGNNDWRESDVHRLGMFDNILIQVELDHFGEGESARTIRSLNLYEFKNDMRWREWKFYPAAKE